MDSPTKELAASTPSPSGGGLGRGATPTNPCIQALGPGPTGRKCGECANLYPMRGTQDRTTYWCTIDPQQQRRVTAPTCSRFLDAVPSWDLKA